MVAGGEEAAEDTKRAKRRRRPASTRRGCPAWRCRWPPIVLPILLITGNAVVKTLAHQELIAADAQARLLRGGELDLAILQAGVEGSGLGAAFRWTNVLGNPNLALFFSAVIAMATLWTRRR